MARRFGTRRALLGAQGGENAEAAIAAFQNDPDALLYYDVQDKVDNGYAVAFNRAVGMPDGTNVVVNGDFATDTVWTKGDAAITISGGKANWSGAQAGNADLTQASILTSGEVYAVTFTISGRTAGTLQPLLGTTAGTAQSTNATFTVYHAANNVNLVFRGNADFDGKLDDVNVQRVITGRNLCQNPFFDTDSIWSKGTGWTIASGKATHAAGTSSVLYQSSISAAGISYQTIFKISGRTAGEVRITISNALGTLRSADGIYTERITGTSGTSAGVTCTSDFDGSIEFVIVRPISSATKGRYGRELVQNRFVNSWTGDNPDGWTVTEAGDATSNITENPAGHCQIISDGTLTQVSQPILTIGKTYVATLHVSTVTSGIMQYGDSGNTSPAVGTVGVHKYVFTAVTTQFIMKRATACNITIDYVSCEQILIQPSTAFTTAGTNPLDLTNTAIAIQQDSGNKRVGVLMSGNGTTSKALPGLTEMNSIFPKDKGAIRLVFKSGTWAAGTDYLFYFGADANNAVYAYRDTANIIVGYKAGGTAEEVTIASGSPTASVYVGLDWDTSGSGAVRAIWQGAQSGATQTIAGVFVGNFAATLALYFAASSTPTSVLDGGLAHVVWFDAIPTAAEDLAFAGLLGIV